MDFISPSIFFAANMASFAAATAPSFLGKLSVTLVFQNLSRVAPTSATIASKYHSISPLVPSKQMSCRLLPLSKPLIPVKRSSSV